MDVSILIPGTSPRQVAMSCRLFLDSKLPSSVAKLPCEAGQIWRVEATVFVDYVPLNIELCTSEASDGATCVTMRHSSRNDVVLFKRVSQLFADFLSSAGLKVMLATGASINMFSEKQVGLVDDDFADFLDVDSTEAEHASWSQRVNLAWLDFDSRNTALHKDAIHSLARLAASAPESHPALAEGLADRSSTVVGIFFAKEASPVTEMYPMASLLRCLACGDSAEANMILRKSAFAQKLDKYKHMVANLPPIVSREMGLAVERLQEHLAPKYISQQDNFLSSASTRCPDMSNTQSLADDSTTGSFTPAKRLDAAQRMADMQIPPKVLQIIHITDDLFKPSEICD